jgi:hypothetical protein
VDLPSDVLHLRARASRDGDVRAGRRQLSRNVRTDPAPASGDERDLAGQIILRRHDAGG